MNSILIPLLNLRVSEILEKLKNLLALLVLKGNVFLKLRISFTNKPPTL
jgi:hypothetical protein